MSTSSKQKIAMVLSETSSVFTPEQGAVSTVVCQLADQLRVTWDCRVFMGGQVASPADPWMYYSVRTSWASAPLARFFEPSAPYLKALAQNLNEWKPDIVHIHNRPQYIVWLKKYLSYHPRFILHEHNLQCADWIPEKKARQYLELADALVGVSQFTVDTIVKKFPFMKNKAYAVTNAVNAESFIPVATAAEKAAARTRFSLPSDKQVILYTGAMRACKGVHTLLTAFIELLSRRQDTVLVLAGENAENNRDEDGFYRSLRDQARPFAEHIRFLGFVGYAEMPLLYQSADIYCALPEWEEPLGLVFLEAQACGLPVVATRSGGVPEVVRDGETGFLLSTPVSVSEWLSKMTNLLDNTARRQAMSARARAWVTEAHTWERAGREMLVVMNTTILRVIV